MRKCNHDTKQSKQQREHRQDANVGDCRSLRLPCHQIPTLTASDLFVFAPGANAQSCYLCRVWLRHDAAVQRPIALTSNIVSIAPTRSKTSTTGINLPTTNGAVGSMNIKCNAPGPRTVSALAGIARPSPR